MPVSRCLLVDLGRHSGDLTEGLARGLSNVTRVEILASKRSHFLERFRSLDRVTVHVIERPKGAYFISRINEIRRIRRAIKEIQPEIIIDIGLSVYGLAIPNKGFWVARMAHDPIPHPGFRDRLVRSVMQRSWRKSAALIALSEYCGTILRQITQVPVLVTSLGDRHGIPNRDPEKIADRRNNLLFWGRIEPYKGLETLLSALPLALLENSELRLRIVGNGKLPDGSLGNQPQIEVSNGWLDVDTIADHLDWAGVMILPYSSASQSGPAAGSLTNGIPTIATSVGALPEQVRDRRTGLVVTPGDAAELASAILEISMNRSLALKFSEASLHISETEENWTVQGPKLFESLFKLYEYYASQERK